MRWGRNISPIAIASLTGFALCLVALLALSSVALAQTPGKGADAKADPAKDPKADAAPDPNAPIDWKPGGKLDWKQFEGGPPADGYTAQVSVGLYYTFNCPPPGGKTLSVSAKMNPKDSLIDPDLKKQTAAGLAHEQGHFDLAEKFARKLKTKLREIMDKECDCDMTAEKRAKLVADLEAAKKSADEELDAEELKYDEETNNGKQETDDEKAAQKKWTDAIANDLKATPAAAPAATGTDKSADAGTGKPATPGTGNPAAPGADKPAAPETKKSAAKGAKKSNSGDSGFTPPTDEVASNEVVFDNACPPPKATYVPFPGTPGQQYATMIPGFRAPGENASYSVPFATDSTTYCTFGEGTGVPGYTTATDDNGVDVPPSSYGGGTDGTPGGPGPQTVSTGNPKTPRVSTPGDATTPRTATTPKPVDTPTAKTTDGPKTASTPTPTPSDTPVATITDKPVPQPTDTPQPASTPTTDIPQTTTTDTPQTTTDDTPPVHITIYIKASEAVLDGGPTGEPIQGQIVKLVMREKPALPTTAENKPDTGYDKPAPQCTTGATGECKVDVPPDDRSLYAMNQTPRIGGKPVNNFRLAINLMKHTGGIAETTGKPVPDLRGSMTSGNVTAEPVKIGNRTFVRLGFNTPYGATGDLVEKYSKLLGVPVEIDICLVKEPGPPLGSEQPGSYQAINQELPHAAINLRPGVGGRAARP
jgi:hypothetical protein